MPKVLIIEPHRMLRQALILTLVPEYEVQLGNALEGADNPQADALIVDFAALQESGTTPDRIVEFIQKRRVPTVLIDGAQPAELPEREALVRVKAPVGKESLKAALAECLRSPSAAAQVAGPVAGADRTEHNDRTSEAKPSVIELTDIVEENC